MKILDRYLLREIIGPFFMVLFILTFVLLIGRILQIMDLLVNKGVGFSQILLLLAYLMPSFLIRTVPISLLAAVLMGLGRLSADNELIVMKASGIPLSRIARPVLAFAVAATLFTASMAVFFSPASSHAMRSLLFEIARQKAGIGIKEKVFNDRFKDIVLYAEKIDPRGDFMENVFISDNRLLREPTVITARKAFLVSDPDRMTLSLRLVDGSSHQADPGKGSYKKMDFRTYDLNLDLSGDLEQEAPDRRKSTEMGVSELIREMGKRNPGTAEGRELRIELHKKFTLPLSCFLFALVGIPLSMGRHRSGKARGFSLAIMVVLVYYVLQIGVESLGEEGRLPAVAGAWLPDAVFAVAGGILFYSASRERFLLPDRFLSLPASLRARILHLFGHRNR